MHAHTGLDFSSDPQTGVKGSQLDSGEDHRKFLANYNFVKCHFCFRKLSMIKGFKLPTDIAPPSVETE